MKAVQQAVQVLGNDIPLPRLPKRQGDVKGKQTAEDLFKLFTVIDERKLIYRHLYSSKDRRTRHSALPRFVAEDLSRILFVTGDSVNILAMAKKLEHLEMRINSVECFLSSSCIRYKDNCRASNDNVMNLYKEAWTLYHSQLYTTSVQCTRQDSRYCRFCSWYQRCVIGTMRF